MSEPNNNTPWQPVAKSAAVLAATVAVKAAWGWWRKRQARKQAAAKAAIEKEAQWLRIERKAEALIRRIKEKANG